MDHDKQVTDLVKRTRDQFLGQPLHPDEIADNYDLELEFKKSSKNKSLLVPLLCAVFLIVLGSGAVIATLLADKATKQTTVKIGNFEDLKLRDLFDRAKKNQRDLEEVNAQITILSQDYQKKVADLKQSIKDQEDVVDVSSSSPQSKRDKKSALESSLNSSLFDAKRNYETKKADLTTKAKDIQKRVDEYDSRIGSINKANQTKLDNQKKLAELQLTAQKTTYERRLTDTVKTYRSTITNLKADQKDYVTSLKERHDEEIQALILKYNPVFDDPALTALFASYKDSNETYTPGELPNSLVAPDLISSDFHKDLQQKSKQVKDLLALMKKVPYENSVPSMLTTIDGLLTKSLNGYDSYLIPLGKKVELLQKDAWGVENYVESIKEDGVIIDPRNKDSILLALKKSKKLPAGTTLLVKSFENNDEVGEVVLLDDSETLGKMTNQRNIFRGLKPFDKLSIKLK